MVRQKDLEIDAKFGALEKVIIEKNSEMISTVEKLIKSLDKDIDGEMYIHTPDFDDVASNKGATFGSRSESITYTRKIYDIQILNSLIVFCLAKTIMLNVYICTLFR